MDAKPGTPEGLELDALTDLVVRYEAADSVAVVEAPSDSPC
jgi:hypothetical protein